MTWDNLCNSWSSFHCKFPQDMSENTAHCRERRSGGHRGHSPLQRGHCTLDSPRGKGHIDDLLHRSQKGRTCGTYAPVGRCQACTLCMFSHGCNLHTSLGKVYICPPCPHASQGKSFDRLPDSGQDSLHMTDSWWHFLHMFCKKNYTFHMCHLLHRSHQDTWNSICLYGGLVCDQVVSDTFCRYWLQNKRHILQCSPHSCHSSLRATCPGDKRRHMPVPANMCP